MQGKRESRFLKIPIVTIVGILERMGYCNTHEATVEEAVFEQVQELRANKRRPTKAKRQGLFSGLVYCTDCGSKLYFATCKSF